MIPLLADQNTQDYNIIAIQEPWHNLSAPTTLNFHQSGFHLLYCPGDDTRVCFYINDSINLESWEVKFPSANMCTLKITTHVNRAFELVHIHNVYNPFSTSYSFVDSLSIFSVIRSQLDVETHHILLGDFNLHHPFWNNSLRSTHHLAADQLLEIVDDKNLLLTLSKSTIT